VDEAHKERKGCSSIVENTEEVFVLCGSILARWRQHLLESGGMGWGLAAVMWVMQVHEGPSLRRMLAIPPAPAEAQTTQILTKASQW